jgi:AcrR family transcriptional regulator
MRDLAKAAGIQAPGIYHYFKGKKDILYEIDENSWKKFSENILDEMTRVQDPEEKIKIYIRNMINYQLALGHASFLVNNSLSTKLSKKRNERDTRVFHLLRDILRDAAKQRGDEKAIDPTIAAFSLFGMVANIYKWYKPKGRISLEELIEQIILHFFHGFYGK